MTKKPDCTDTYRLRSWRFAAVTGIALQIAWGVASAQEDSAEDLFGLETADPVTEPTPAEDTPETDSSDSADALFGTEEDAESAADDAAAAPEATDELFDTGAEVAQAPARTWRFDGFWQNELAYTAAEPEHFSKWRNVFQLAFSGHLRENIRWHAAGRIYADPIYEIDNFYGDRVEDDQKLDGWVDETYLEISAGNWEFTLGRQHIIWGEVVGLFFADVVSALDLREFVLPEFELIRIPQWATRAEYFGELADGEFHADIIFLPYFTTDNIGEPGADFYPFELDPIAGVETRYLDEQEPDRIGADSGFGVRGSYLKNGWDTALFYYTSPDRSAALQRFINLGPQPELVLRPIHERIHQFGATLAKDVGDAVVKSEAVYTRDRLSTVNRLSDFDGLIKGDELRYLVGVDYALGKTTFNAQFFQTWFIDYDSDMIPDEVESGLSIFLSTKALHPRVEPEILWIRSLDRNEWLLETKVTWTINDNWSTVAGLDIFEGPQQALLGQYDDQDRVYLELRFNF